MPSYLYVFGFCTPAQWQRNNKHGSDDEDSYAFFIEAEYRAQAFEFGKVISELFVNHLFKEAGWNEEIPSWVKSDFAHWIEDEPSSRFSDVDLETLPVISVNKMPAFAEWVLKDGFGELKQSKSKQIHGEGNNPRKHYALIGMFLGIIVGGSLCGIGYMYHRDLLPGEGYIQCVLHR